jgi:hypothetical protein
LHDLPINERYVYDVTGLKAHGLARWSFSPPLSGCGSLLLSESFRDPNRCQLAWADLFPSRDTPEPVQSLRIERDRERLRRWPSQPDVNRFAFIEKPREILVAETIPFFGLFAKSAPLCRPQFLRHC